MMIASIAVVLAWVAVAIASVNWFLLVGRAVDQLALLLFLRAGLRGMKRNPPPGPQSVHWEVSQDGVWTIKEGVT